MFKNMIVLMILCLIGIEGLAEETQHQQVVITTLFPTYDFARQIGQGKVNVSLLLPPGVEAHSFEPKPTDIVKLNHADFFIYTGRYMEPWVEKMLTSLSNPHLVIIDASEGIALIADEDEEDEAANPHEKDPHIWLDLANAQHMVDTIAHALAKKDERNRAFYLDQARSYNAKLAALDARFQATLATAKYKTLIYGGHFVFGYFAKRYGLTYRSAYPGFSPNAEPSPKAIAELIQQLQQSGLQVIYHEELLDPKVARIIAQETGARLELLHGAHNLSREEFSSGLTFLAIMEANLAKLKVGLACQ